MRYFILYYINDPRSLGFGLHLHEAADEAAALAFLRSLPADSGARLIRGVELLAEQGAGPLRAVVL